MTMSYRAEGITRVRLAPLALDVAGGQAVSPPGAVEVTWNSTQEGCWHQVYVNGCLAGVTARASDRRLVVSAPVGRDGPAGALAVEVVAVDAADRWTDFAGQLAGFPEAGGMQVRLSWQAGEYLDPNLESFDVFGDDRTGAVDYAAALNEAPVPARPGGQAPWGYGAGGYGVGGYGRSAARYEWTTGTLEPGSWRFAVVAVDAAGNRLETAAEASVIVAPVPRPPSDFRVGSYSPEDHVATLTWEPSPDV
jgi:hypothetical protein